MRTVKIYLKNKKIYISDKFKIGENYVYLSEPYIYNYALGKFRKMNNKNYMINKKDIDYIQFIKR